MDTNTVFSIADLLKEPHIWQQHRDVLSKHVNWKGTICEFMQYAAIGVRIRLRVGIYSPWCPTIALRKLALNLAEAYTGYMPDPLFAHGLNLAARYISLIDSASPMLLTEMDMTRDAMLLLIDTIAWQSSRSDRQIYAAELVCHALGSYAPDMAWHACRLAANLFRSLTGDRSGGYAGCIATMVKILGEPQVPGELAYTLPRRQYDAHPETTP